ncbi:PKD domain-containing protein [Galbibacter mesophilus]|uniref:PKD domain-containing protein n=1 Tax=Galbibacter mesophilus TaxID=379069 RepID=UPI00191C9897|nr:gliding motility-associated C-terminal domain-containing protein [Galbibacter mesophilus]MCM5663567.1 gliding motility-associated C-terminal domain-containing protein [Galbibacter mesophilus]
MAKFYYSLFFLFKTRKPFFGSPLYRSSFFLVIFFCIGIYQLQAQNCSVNAGIDETICGDVTTFNLSGSSAGNITTAPSWSQISGPSVTIADPSNLNTEITGIVGGNTYGFRLTAGCEDGVAVFQDVEITVQNITVANAGSDIETCPDSSGGTLITGNPPSFPGEVGEWSIVGGNGAGVTINNPSSNSTTIDLSETSAGTTTLRWTITGPEYAPGERCQTFDEITITNYGGEEPVDAGPDKTLNSCYTVSQSTQLDGSFAGNGTGGQQGTWEFVSGPRQPNIVDPNNNTTQVNGLYEGVYVFRWNVSGPCVTGSDTVTITVDEATQDVTKASVADNNQVFCNPSVTQTTLVGNEPEFAGETVLWRQTSGPPANITNPNSSTTEVTGLSYNNTYKFDYTITNQNTGCSTRTNVTVSYSDNNLSIEANNGMDIIAECGELNIEIPFTTTGNGVNEYSIVSGPAGAFTYPTPYQSFENTSPLLLMFEKSGTYNVALRRRVTGDILSECDVATSSINVTVAVAPTPANGGTNQVLECGVTTTELTGNEVESGTSLWAQISGPSNATFIDPYARVTEVSGLVPGNYVFRYLVTAAGGACVSSETTQSDVLVVVSENIRTDESDAGPDQNGICRGIEVQLAGNNLKPGQVGTWQQVPDGTPQTVVFADANDPNTTATGFDVENQSYTLEWLITSESASCITSSVDQVVITTSDTEGPTPAQAGDDRCYPSGTIDISLQGNEPRLIERGTWTVVPSGPVIADINDPSTSVTIPGDGEYTFTWTISSPNGCEDTSDDVLIVIEDEAEADAGPDQTDCSNSFIMAANSSNGRGEWTQVLGPGGFTIVDPNSPNTEITFTFSGSYVFEWTVSAGECSTDSDQVTINVGLPPTQAVAGPDQTVCNGGNTVTLSANDFDPNTETGTWSVAEGARSTPTITDPNDPNTTVTGLLTGEYTFIWSIKGDPNCPASSDETLVTISTPANAGNDKNLCNATNVSLQAEEGSTGTWSQVSTTGNNAVISQSGNSNLANAQIEPGTDYVFRFTTDTPGCITSDDVAINNSGLPEFPPNAGSDDQVCQADLNPTNTYTLNGNAPPTGATAEWRIADQPNGAAAAITDPSNPTTTVTNLTVPGFYILEWNFSVGNCTTESDVFRLTVFQEPSDPDAGPDQDNACVLSAQMNAVVPTAGVGTWTFATDPSNGDAIIDSPNSPTTTISNITALGTYTLTWTVSTGPFPAPSACTPKEDTVNITFTDEPPFEANAGPDQELCLIAPAPNLTTTLDAEDFPSGDPTIGTWTVVSGPNTPNFANANNPNTAVLNLVAGEYEFLWTTEKGGCTDEDSMKVTVFASPTTADAGPNQTIAEFTPLILAGNTPTTGTGTWSQLDGPTPARFTNPNNPQTSVNDIIKGTYYFAWTIENGVCDVSSDVVKIEVIGSADLELTKTASVQRFTPNVVSPGDIVTFTIEVFNNNITGTSDATGVTVADLLPNGYTIINNTISDNGIYYSGNSAIVWEDLSIALGETKSLSFEATVKKEGNFENRALIIASDQRDPDSDPNSGFNDDDLNDGIADDDEDSAVVLVEPADLELTKSANASSANINEEVIFRLDLVNNGPGGAADISVKDTIPSGYTFVNGSANNNGVYNPGDKSITWSGIVLNGGFTRTLTYRAFPNATGTDYTNVAEITSSNNLDPNSDPNVSTDEDDLNDGIPDNDETELTVPVAQTDLSLEKVVDNANPNVGETVTFTLTLTNESNVDATNVTVEDYVPAGYRILTINNNGIRSGNTIRWTGFNIPAQTSLTAVVTMEVLAPKGTIDEYLNVAQVTEMDQLDSDSSPDNDDGDQSEDDETSISVTPQVADLSLTKTVSILNPILGDNVTFTVTVTNDGPNNATGVSIVDVLPSGYTLQTVNNGGFASGNTATWNNLSIANGANVVLTYEATVIQGNGTLLSHTNTAQVTASDQFDPNSTPNNNRPTEDDQAVANVVPQNLVDIGVTKVSDIQTVTTGDVVTFTVQVSNNGPSDATGVLVQDRMGDNLDYQSNTAPTGTSFTFNTGTNEGLWNIGNLAAGDDISITITAQINGNAVPDEYLNVAELTGLTQTDSDSTPGNNLLTEDDQDEVDLSAVLSSDLSLTKTVDLTEQTVGSEVTFSITVLNDGPSTATGVEITDILPNGYTFSSFTVTDGSYVSATGVWTLDTNLGVGESENLQIIATVNPTGDYVNQAEVTASDNPDPDSTPNNGPNSEDDFAEVEVTPIPLIDLELIKDVDINNTDIGDEIVFTVQVINNGPSDATGVTVKDLLPAKLEYVSDDAGGSYDTATGIWDIGDLAVSASETLTISAKVLLYDDSQPIPLDDYLNVAEVFSANEEDINSTPNNGPNTENDYDQEQITPNPTRIDLVVVKTPDNFSPTVGDEVVFSVTVTNDGPQDASGVIVTDKLNEPGFGYVTHTTSVGDYEPASGAWNVGDVPVGVTETLTITATVQQVGSYVNTAQVTDQDQIGESVPANNDPSEDDYSSINLTPIFPADLQIEKSVNNGTPEVGSVVNFSINVTNNGPAIATGVEVTDLLPDGYTFVGATGTGIYDETTGIWLLNQPITVGETVNGTIVARVNATGNYLNVAEITAADQTDPDLSNNQDDAEIIPNAIIDLSLDKVVSKLQPEIGETISFTLSLTNDGPSEATGVEVTDLLPSGYTFVSSSAPIAYNDATGVWNAPTIGVDETIFLQINATVNDAGTYLNIAEVTAADQEDINSTPNNGNVNEDDYDRIAILPKRPVDIEVEKVVDNETPGIGDEITYTISVLNNSNGGTNVSDATGLAVRDILPSGLNFVEAVASTGTYDENVGTWDLGDLANGATATLTITATVRAIGNYVNTAELIASDNEDPDSTPGNGVAGEDDQSTITIMPSSAADLSLTKTVNNPTPNTGENVQFIITINNDGPGIATGMEVTEYLPSGFTFVGAVPTDGVYNASTGVWDLSAPMLPGSTQSITIVARVNAATGTANEYLNTTEITVANNNDPDSTPGNGVTTEDDYAEVAVTPASLIDLSLTKTVNLLRPDTGDEVVFTIVISNAGPSTATGVQVMDMLPAGYTYVSDNVFGLYDAATGIWDVGELGDNESKTLEITATVNPSGSYVNIAEVSAANETDVDSTPGNGNPNEDDQDQAQILPRVVLDIGLEKTVDNTSPTIGRNVVFTITASNLGVADATNVGIEEILPSGYEFVSAATSTGNYDESVGVWSIPTFVGNSSETLTITAEVVDVNDYVNVVTLAFLDQIDTNPDNDRAEASVTPNCLTIYNEFSPNRDGVNDFFTIDCISQYPNNRLEVYNRWGSLVHAENRYNNDWDGTTDGKATDKVLPVGTYYYILDLGDGSEPTSGWLYIIK